MTLFEGMQNRWILFIRDFEILAPSCIGTGLLRKLQGIEHNRVWMKKKSVRRNQSKANEKDTGSSREGRASELVI